MRRQRLHRAHDVDIGGDEGARIQPQRVTEGMEFVGQFGLRGIERIEADGADLAEWEMHRHRDRRPRHRPAFKIGEIDRSQVGIGLAQVKAPGVHPERLAFEAAGGGQRRIERDPRIAPPHLLAARPAEHVLRQQVALGIDRGALVGNVVGRGGTHPAFHRDRMQRLGCRPDIVRTVDPYRVDPLLRKQQLPSPRMSCRWGSTPPCPAAQSPRT